MWVHTTLQAGGPFPLPFPAYESWWVSQQWYTPGGTHANEAAWDFNYGSGNMDDGKAVTSVCDGVISYAGHTGGPYGRVIQIDCGDELARYAHLKTINVTAGQSVTLGLVIGQVGGSGCSDGQCSDYYWPVHLHFNFMPHGASPSSSSSVERQLIYKDSNGYEVVGVAEGCSCSYNVGWNSYTATIEDIPTVSYEAIVHTADALWGRGLIDHEPDGGNMHWWRGQYEEMVIEDWVGGDWGHIWITHDATWDQEVQYDGTDHSPHTGYVVRHGFKAAYWDRGGIDTFGSPRGDEMDISANGDRYPAYDKACDKNGDGNISLSERESCISEYCGSDYEFTSMQRFEKLTLCWAGGSQNRACVVDWGECYYGALPPAPATSDTPTPDSVEDSGPADPYRLPYLMYDLDGDGYDDVCLRDEEVIMCDTTLDGAVDSGLSYGNVTGTFSATGNHLYVRFGNSIYDDFTGDGAADRVISYGSGAEDQYLVHGNSIFLRTGNRFLVDTNWDGITDQEFTYGNGASEDGYYVADLNGDWRADVIVRRGNVLYVDEDLDGSADQVVHYGNGNQELAYVFGDVNGDNRDDVGVVRYDTSTSWYISTDASEKEYDDSYEVLYVAETGLTVGDINHQEQDILQYVAAGWVGDHTSPQAVYSALTGNLWVYYIADTNQLYELGYHGGTTWSAKNLSSQLGLATAASHSQPMMQVNTVLQHSVVAYMSASGRIQLADSNQQQWTGYDVFNQVATAWGDATSDPAVSINQTTGELFIAYQSSNHRLYELRYANSTWTSQDVSALVKHEYLATGTSPSSIVHPSTQERFIAFTSDSGNVYVAHYQYGSWTITNVSTLTSGVPADVTTSPTVYVDSRLGYVYVVYISATGEIIRVQYAGHQWQSVQHMHILAQLGNATAAQYTAPAVYVVPDTYEHVISFTGRDGWVYQIVDHIGWVSGGQIRTVEPVQSQTQPTSVYDPTTQQHYSIFTSPNHRLQLYVQPQF